MDVRDSNTIFQQFKSSFIPVSKDYKDEFYSRIAKENLVRVIIIGIIYILFEIMIMITKKKIPTVHENTFSVFVIIFHIMSILISFWLRFKEKHINGMITQIFIYLYCVVLVYWSITISLGRVKETGSITMFILTLTGTSALFYRRSLITLITNFGFYIYFIFNIKLLEKLPIVKKVPSTNRPIGHFPPRHPPAGNFPPVNPPAGNAITSILTDAHIYISDALLMTMVCCVLGIIVYRLRLKVFLEQKALEELTLKDSMTNLFNHKTICNSLEKEVKRSKRNLQPVSILMIDIDHFKMINDNYGHQVGDQVIIKIAKLLVESCRETDYVGRYGGEEFLVVLTNTNKDAAKKFGERIREEIEKIDFGLSSGVTVSGGVRTYENESAQEMISLADKALYQAKQKGRNCIISA